MTPRADRPAHVKVRKCPFATRRRLTNHAAHEWRGLNTRGTYWCPGHPVEHAVPAFVAIAEFALARGGKSIKDLPGCWECEIDERWWVAVNGHKTPTTCSKGQEVPPFAAYVEFNGWPAGILDAFGGSFAAGSLANEETFLEALRVARPSPMTEDPT